MACILKSNVRYAYVPFTLYHLPADTWCYYKHETGFHLNAFLLFLLKSHVLALRDSIFRLRGSFRELHFHWHIHTNKYDQTDW